MGGCSGGGGTGKGKKGGTEAARPGLSRSQRLYQHMADDSTSGIIPVFGMIFLLVIIIAAVSLVF
jgi:hypothetical protein